MGGVGDVFRLDRLRVVGGQPREDQHPDRRDREHHRGRAEEDVDDRGDDEPDQTHHQERPHPREVALRGVAIERQAREGRRGGNEGLHDREAGKGQEDPADRQAHERAEGVEIELPRRGRKAVRDRPEAEHHDERGEHDYPAQRRGIERDAEPGQVDPVAELARRDRGIGRGRKTRDRPGRERGDDHPHGHEPVDLVHVGAKPLIDPRCARARRGRADRFKLCHLQASVSHGESSPGRRPEPRCGISGLGGLFSSFPGRGRAGFATMSQRGHGSITILPALARPRSIPSASSARASGSLSPTTGRIRPAACQSSNSAMPARATSGAKAK